MNSSADRLKNDETYLAALRHDMIRFARLQLRDEHLAEDVVQEALVAALTGNRGFEGRSALKTWVFAILRNKIVDAIRVRSRSVNISALTDEEVGLDEAFDALFKPNAHWHPEARPRDWGDPEAAMHQDQFWAVFDACLNHLPPNTARVFMMREFLEFDTDEVCAELRISVSNCHVILHRARNGLRRCLEQSWFAGEVIIMLSCKETTQRLSEAQDRDLGLSEKIRLKMHLAMCSGCSNFSKQLDFLRVACKRYTNKAGQNDSRQE